MERGFIAYVIVAYKADITLRASEAGDRSGAESTALD